MVIIYGGIQQDGIILSVHTKTVDTSLKRNSTRRKSGGSNGLKQGNQVFIGYEAGKIRDDLLHRGTVKPRGGGWRKSGGKGRQWLSTGLPRTTLPSTRGLQESTQSTRTTRLQRSTSPPSVVKGQLGKNLNGSRGNQSEIDGSAVSTTTEGIIGGRIVQAEKNDKTQSTQKVEPAANDQLENRNSIFDNISQRNRVDTHINRGKNQLSTIFPTFATRYNFPEKTTPAPESTTTKVDVELLEKELLDVLDRLAESYTDSPESQ